jgi:hypothetical protein
MPCEQANEAAEQAGYLENESEYSCVFTRKKYGGEKCYIAVKNVLVQIRTVTCTGNATPAQHGIILRKNIR